MMITSTRIRTKQSINRKFMAHINNNTTGLKRFAKGTSGNPGGRPKKSFAAEKQRLISYHEFVFLIQKFVEMKRPEIKEYLERPEATMFELIYGRLVVEAAKGDRTAREMLTERLFGRVKEQIEMLTHVIEPKAPTFVVEMTEAGKFVTQRPKKLMLAGVEESPREGEYDE